VTTPIRTETRFFTSDEPIALDAGSSLPGFTLAYEQYGELNEARDNAILVFHALTGSQHAAGLTESVAGVGERWTVECQTGWWDAFIGPGRALDTDRFAVFCINYLGGCYGSTGPSSENPETGTPYGGVFPAVSVDDIVNSQLKLLDHLGVEKLHAVTGASMGALMCLSLAVRFPDRVDLAIPIAGGLEVTALQFIHNFEQINAIVNDPSFEGGDYYSGPRPDRGLALARMIGHKTFVSLAAMEERARGEVVDPNEASDYIHISHPIESYLWHQGQKFVRRFDANSYLRFMEAWQGFDLRSSVGAATYEEALRACKDQVFMVFSIDSDVCFYPEEQERMMQALKTAGVPARRITVHSEKGHDSFLLEPSLFAPHLRQTLEQPWGVD
jgi:homoserine O-acetyltransferase